jgi:hypothetical protein
MLLGKGVLVLGVGGAGEAELLLGPEGVAARVRG